MLIKFQDLINNYGIKPTGVIHCGGSHAEELEDYKAGGVERMIWIEAIPEIFEKMEDNLRNEKGAIAVNVCLSDEDGKRVEFHITGNAGQSSSMLKMKDHKKFHPDVKVVETIKLTTKKLDTIIDKLAIVRGGIDVANYDFLNMDLQGAELLALKGFTKNLHKIKYAYLEVNKSELYEGCAQVEEIDAFLKPFGFSRVETKWTDCNWGDAFYINIKAI